MTYLDDLRKREAEYFAKSAHYLDLGDKHAYLVYWGMYTAIFYARVEYQRQKNREETSTT